MMMGSANMGETQRENYVSTPDLLGTCVCCLITFEKRQHNQVTCGADPCRKSRQQYVIREVQHQQYIERQWARRRGKSLVVFLGETRGPKARDAYREQHQLLKDKVQVHSRCTHCGTEFVNEKGDSTPSSFEFCGESLLQQGKCKRAWMDAQQTQASAELRVVISQPLDEERLAKTKRIHAPKAVHIGRLKLNFCPQCRDYVNQDHEHTL